ncbi:MAG TPA: hypothetical protein VFW98_08820 [Gemmatimonadaceae bacterium]|nr:hypothetical protein [Gemmatimonadaceae bacterium]
MHRSAITHLKRSDATLARVIERVGPCRFRPEAAGTHFDAVARAIVYQQLSGSAAHTIYTRLLAIHGTPPTAAQLLAAPDAQLRAVGLSRQKIGYLRDLATRASTGDVSFDTLHDLPDAGIVTALTRVKGVGLWTAQMFLIFRLGRPNVLPDLDLGIRKAIQRAYRMRALPSAERIQRLGRKWEPHCTIASWYLWQLLDVDGVAGTPAAKRQGAASGKNGGVAGKNGGIARKNRGSAGTRGGATRRNGA